MYIVLRTEGYHDGMERDTTHSRTVSSLFQALGHRRMLFDASQSMPLERRKHMIVLGWQIVVLPGTRRYGAIASWLGLDALIVLTSLTFRMLRYGYCLLLK